MHIDATTLIYFSPTRTTRTVLEGIGAGIGSPTQHIDLTPPSARSRALPDVVEGVAVIGTPVYSGRIPPEAARRLRRLQGSGTPAIVVVVYGNRAYDDALLELRDTAAEIGFVPLAGAAFIGEHSYDSPETPIATGRPDAADLEKARDFGASVGEKVRLLAKSGDLPMLQVPGSNPYHERRTREPGAPTTIDTLCTSCGLCVAACPMAAIDAADPLKTNRTLCIFCSACVKVCPDEARVWREGWVERASIWLTENCAARKEPEVFL